MAMNNSSGEVQSEQTKLVEQLALELADLNPKPVSHLTPDNMDEIVAELLKGNTSSLDTATYSKLDAIDFDARAAQYEGIVRQIYAHPEIPAQHHHVYQSYVDRCLDTLELMRQAKLYRTAANETDKLEAESAFKSLNEKLYGGPNLQTTQAMVSEILNDVSQVADPAVAKVRDEFFNLLPDELKVVSTENIKLDPSEEARETVAIIVESVYSPLLKHVDEIASQLAAEKGVDESEVKFGPQDIARVFQTIIDAEFPDSGWKVELRKAKSIFVEVSTKTVIVPEDRVPASIETMRGLVNHELGVHMLRSIIGEKSNLIPLRFGLSGSNDAEEGMGKVMESPVVKDDSRTGHQHYLTAALFAQGYDFKAVTEVMWRYKVLDSYLEEPESTVDDEFISDQKTKAIKIVLRSVRGTNKLPWHTTLSYFNGTRKIWDYIEEHVDDPDFIILMFLGKIDPTDSDHVRGALDAKTRPESQ
jgi:hypothetical protein